MACNPALIFLAVASVFFTAVCALRLESQGSAGVRLLALMLVAIGVTYNFSNAVGLAAGHRSEARSAALTQQGARGSLADDARTIIGAITKLDNDLGTSSVSSLRSEIAAREYDPLFSRSRKCADATAIESRAHCAAWEKAKAMLAAAEQRERLAADLARINVQLRAAPVVEAADPQAEAIVHALGFAGMKVSDPRDVGYALVLLLAAIAELMAAFGGLMCGVRLPGHEAPPVAAPERPRAAGTARRGEAAPDAAPAATAAQGDALAAFIGDLVKSDRPTSFKQLFEMYETACRAAGADPATRRAVGVALSKRFDKPKGGDAAYYARPRLSAVAAAA
jgi:hypothetical protein